MTDLPAQVVLLVPGCRVLLDGRPSPALSRRASGAAARWREALGTERPGEARPLPLLIGSGAGGEAAAIAGVARAAGVPEAAIRQEARARTTEENARFTAELLAAEGVDPAEIRLIVCTDRWHLPRCLRVCRRHFGPGAEGWAIPAPVTAGLLLREGLARAWYAVCYPA